jgi:hypothetical protein
MLPKSCWPAAALAAGLVGYVAGTNAETEIHVSGIAHIRVTAPVPDAHIACMKTIDRYLDGMLTAAKDQRLLPFHRGAHYRDFLEIQEMNWGVPTRLEAEDMIAKANTQLVEDEATLEKFRENMKEAQRRADEPTSDRLTRDLYAQAVAAAAGLFTYQRSRVSYQQAKLAFARCAIANGVQ